MEEVGVVIKVKESIATVVVQKKGTCDSCTEGACESTSEGMKIDALNPLNAKKGQTVRIVIRPGTYLRGSMLFYGLPLIFFIAGTIAGNAAAGKYFPGSNAELISAASGFAALIISIVSIKLWTDKGGENIKFRPYIEEIIE